MKTRREFLRRCALLGAAVGIPTSALAKPREPDPFIFTKKVRQVTKKIAINPGRWRLIVAHHSAVKYGNASIYNKAHLLRGMENGLAYHFVIGNGIDSGDGEIEIGNRWLKQLNGGHVHREEVNAIAIGICLVGNFEKTSPSKKQLAAFQELMNYLRSEVVGKKIGFAVHKEVDPKRTVCPGRNFPIAQMHRLYGPFIPSMAA